MIQAKRSCYDEFTLIFGAVLMLMLEPLLIHAITGEWKLWPSTQELLKRFKEGK